MRFLQDRTRSLRDKQYPPGHTPPVGRAGRPGGPNHPGRPAPFGPPTPPGTRSDQRDTRSYLRRRVPKQAPDADMRTGCASSPLHPRRNRTRRGEASPARRGLLKIVRAVGAVSAAISVPDTTKPTVPPSLSPVTDQVAPAETTRTDPAALTSDTAPMWAPTCLNAPLRAPIRPGARAGPDSHPKRATSGHAQRHQTAHAIVRSRVRDTHGPGSNKINLGGERDVPTRPRGTPRPDNRSQKHPYKLTHSYG